jgi:formylglycine-generating enzyme required for sulfatase activity
MKCITRYGIVIVILGLMVVCGCGKDEQKTEENKQVELPKTITGKDGAEMVLIPAGEFQMGSNDGGDAEKPVHTVSLDAFYMDKYEVTNAQYKKFIDSTGHKAPKYLGNDYNAPEQSVVVVSWHDAIGYAKWAGKRLPTAAEWEKAARGDLTGKKYPWGDKLTHDDANYAGTDRWESPYPVGSFTPNGYGLYDMAGNVWEWCSDWYDENYYSSSPKRNPTGPSSGGFARILRFLRGNRRVVRGGSWSSNWDNLRCACRAFNDPTGTFHDVGFRCCASLSD